MTCGLCIFQLDRAGLNDMLGSASPPTSSSTHSPSFLPMALYAVSSQTVGGVLHQPHWLTLVASYLSCAWDLHSTIFPPANSYVSFKIQLSSHSSRKHAWSPSSVFLQLPQQWLYDTVISYLHGHHLLRMTPPPTTPTFTAILNQG